MFLRLFATLRCTSQFFTPHHCDFFCVEVFSYISFVKSQTVKCAQCVVVLQLRRFRYLVSTLNYDFDWTIQNSQLQIASMTSILQFLDFVLWSLLKWFNNINFDSQLQHCSCFKFVSRLCLQCISFLIILWFRIGYSTFLLLIVTLISAFHFFKFNSQLRSCSTFV